MVVGHASYQANLTQSCSRVYGSCHVILTTGVLVSYEHVDFDWDGPSGLGALFKAVEILESGRSPRLRKLVSWEEDRGLKLARDGSGIHGYLGAIKQFSMALWLMIPSCKLSRPFARCFHAGRWLWSET